MLQNYSGSAAEASRTFFFFRDNFMKVPIGKQSDDKQNNNHNKFRAMRTTVIRDSCT